MAESNMWSAAVVEASIILNNAGEPDRGKRVDKACDLLIRAIPEDRVKPGILTDLVISERVPPGTPPGTLRVEPPLTVGFLWGLSVTVRKVVQDGNIGLFLIDGRVRVYRVLKFLPITSEWKEGNHYALIDEWKPSVFE